LFTAAIDDYARGLSLDLSVLQEQIEALNPNDPEALSESLASGVFAPPETQEQLDAQARLETLIALIDGWIDDVVTQASLAMPSAVALRETLQRRRATGGPAEQTFASLVGLELRPRRVREASQLWTKIREQRGVAGRDALWAHPDLLPTGEDIDSPGKFLGAIPLDLSELDDLKPFEDNEN
jgi:putative hydrolase